MKRPSGLTHRFVQHMCRLAILSLALAELRAGAYMKVDSAPLLVAGLAHLDSLLFLGFEDGDPAQNRSLFGPPHPETLKFPGTLDPPALIKAQPASTQS